MIHGIQRTLAAAAFTLALAALTACDDDKTPQPGDSGAAGTGELERCGDGVKQASEECDGAGDTWECDSACHRKQLYTACRSSSDCGQGQTCSAGACTEECTQQASGKFECPAENIPDKAVGVVCYLVGGDHGYCLARCDNDGDCPRDLRCDDNVCMDRKTNAVDL